ncbi:hypothetical protein NIES2100_71650 [Calothrix sp. NIES-2100]|uniref:hypothetical protein n=1 Tax=Calothrix sp. NIES-2100 TaxID=1954172 RepID=UPI000B620547|nr:hypothetical protein NIES2100_71650 [Calothrix sp. NIES-2100]
MLEKLLLALGLTLSLSLFTGLTGAAPKQTTGSINLHPHQVFKLTQVVGNL